MLQASSRKYNAVIVTVFLLTILACLKVNLALNYVATRLLGLDDKSVRTELSIGDTGGSQLEHGVARPTLIENEPGSHPLEDRSRPTPIPKPNRVWNEYLRHHSKFDPSDLDRKYAVVIYRCPERAGNFLNNLFNSITFAVIHNRTILYDYQPGKYKQKNGEEICNQILKPAPWWRKWEDVKNQLPDPVHVSIKEADDAGRAQLLQHRVVIYPQLPDITQRTPGQEMIGWDYAVRTPKFVKSLDQDARQRLEDWFARGKAYWRGLLFRQLFEIETDFQAVDQAQSYSIAVHSRHTVPGDDGSYIHEETKCLEAMIRKSRNPRHACRVHVMADREATISALGEWLTSKNCSMAVAEHEKPTAAVQAEHGPYSGFGFFRDLQSASQARDGLVGEPERSSFALLEALVAYDRVMDRSFDTVDGNALSDIELCSPPARKEEGYDYGPGTPWFVSVNHRKPFSPIKILKEYEAKSETWENEAVIKWDGCSQSWQQMARQFVWAMAAERRVVLIEIDGCHHDVPWFLVRRLVPRYEGEVIGLPTISSFEQLEGLGHEPIVYLNETIDTVEKAPSEFLEEGESFLLGALYQLSMGEKRWDLSKPGYNDASVAIYLDRTPSEQELKTCLTKMIPSAVDEPCQVFLMANDTNSQAIAKRIVASTMPSCTIEFNITIVDPTGDPVNTLPAEAKEQGHRLLHGIQALSRARRGYIAGPSLSASSVTGLIEARIEYERKMQTWDRGQVPPVNPAFDTCVLGA